MAQPDLYTSCGFFNLFATPATANDVCGTGTVFRDGKCVGIGDKVMSVTRDVCGTGTEFRDGKCVSTVDVTSDNAAVCGTGTVFRDGKCVLDGPASAPGVFQYNGMTIKDFNEDGEFALQSGMSIEDCKRVGTKMGLKVVGHRNTNHGGEPLKDTCWGYTNYTPTRQVELEEFLNSGGTKADVTHTVYWLK